MKYSTGALSCNLDLSSPHFMTNQQCIFKVLRRLITTGMAVDKASVVTNSAWLILPKPFPTALHKTFGAKSYKESRPLTCNVYNVPWIHKPTQCSARVVSASHRDILSST